uniref:Uncharacterized protein n=1 Tax=viral metagenome TaxID=1070528 RepID=A0A6M3L5Z1_9ZZZZ
MSAGGTIDTVGENKEFTSTAVEDITIYFNGGDTGEKTSAQDTATEKYLDNYGTVKVLNIRSDQTIQIVSMNGTTFTDPITIIVNKGHTEKFDVPTLFKMVLRTTVAGTNIKIRVRGR